MYITLFRVFCAVIVSWHCHAHGMDSTEQRENNTMLSYSILSLPEDVLLKIWITGFKKTVIYRVDNIRTIMRPITAVAYVCKAWNILWTKEKKKLSDAAHAIVDPVYTKYSVAGCLIS